MKVIYELSEELRSNRDFLYILIHRNSNVLLYIRRPEPQVKFNNVQIIAHGGPTMMLQNR
jgi:hypothetical protein